MSQGPVVTERLDSWKQIASYMGRTVRTVIRWEQEGGLPVHRVPVGRRQAVYAYPHEIDEWLQGRQAVTVDTADAAEDASHEFGASDSEPQQVPRRESIDDPPRSGSKLQWFSATLALTSAVVISSVVFAAFALRQSTPAVIVANPTKTTRSHTHILSPLLSYGAQIIYQGYENGRYGVAAVPEGGGESADIPTGVNNPELCDLSSVTGAMLLRDLVHSRDDNEPVYVKTENGPPQRVGEFLAYDAAWYPDGRHILISADGVIYSTDLQGRSRRQLFSVPGNAFWFRWAPDGKRLRFTVIDKDSERTSLWEVNSDGKALHRLFPKVKNHLCCGSWTPDGKLFIFQSRVENAFQIWAQRDQSGNWLPIHTQSFPLVSGATSYRAPLASKDGRQMFVRAEAPKGEVVKYNSRVGKFIPILPSISARTLAYSKDRNWIAYTSIGDNNLWRCRADGTECLELTQDFKQTVLPRWSPDGRTIAFMGIHFTGDWGVYSIPSNGGTINPLFSADEAMGYPDWSPDGQQLVFSEVPPVSQAKGIYILDFQSLKISTVPGSADLSYPRWSPDGRFLVAQHSGDLNLHLFDFRSGKWRLLAGVPANYPAWSLDGKYVYFLSENTANREVCRVSVANHTVEKVANLAGVERGPFFLGDWVGLGPDGSPLAVRNATIEDIYAWNLIAW